MHADRAATNRTACRYLKALKGAFGAAISPCSPYTVGDTGDQFKAPKSDRFFALLQKMVMHISNCRLWISEIFGIRHWSKKKTLWWVMWERKLLFVMKVDLFKFKVKVVDHCVAKK